MGLVLGLIAFSFAVWGIGDIFRGFGLSTVAKVGSTEITAEQVRQIYTDRLQQYGRQLGRPITPDQARALRIDQQIVAELVASAALDQRARQLRLNLSNDEIARQIKNNPNFIGLTGRFDPARFEQGIRNAGYTEARFVARLRSEAMRRELVDTVTGDLTLPKTAVAALDRYENEQRAIDFFMLDPARAGEIAPPGADVIAKYFEQRKAFFRAPEYREIVVLPVAAADLARPDEVTDADARSYYDTNRARFGAPERRQVQQIVFPNAEEAKAAAERLEKGLTFAELAAERGLTDKDTDLGLVAKSAILDRAVAEAAFTLKEGTVSAPVQGRFGTTLVSVAKIEPEQTKPFEEISTEIKRAVALDRARTELASRHDKIEDERAGGAKLTEIAAKLNLKARTIAAVDRTGRDPEGNVVADLPTPNLLANAFQSDVGVDNEPIQIQGGGYLWYDVTSITPTRERTLEEVKTRVEERWRAEQIAERLKAKASELAAKLNAGSAMADLATAEGLKVETTFGVKRRTPAQGLSPKLVEAIFTVPKGTAAIAEGADPTHWFVFRLTDIVVPAFDPATPEGKKADDALRSALSDDLYVQYVSRLRADYGTTINADALRRVSGNEQN